MSEYRIKLYKKNLMKCLNCGGEFESSRNTAKYCSDKCKKAFQRLSGTEISGTNTEECPSKEISGTNSVSGTEKTPNGYYFGQKLTNRVIGGREYPDRVVGYCRVCGKEINRSNPLWDLIEVCHSCSSENENFSDQMNDIYHIIRDKLLQFPKEERINIWNRLGGKIMDEK